MAASSWTYALAFGANIAGNFGAPRATLAKAIEHLHSDGVEVLAVSEPIETRPIGGKTRIPYLNAALLVRCRESPAELLRRLKRLERRAGRRTLARNASRPLDLDILLWRYGATGFTRRGRRFGMVQLPHPELHRRSFMMTPLSEVMPAWWHAGLRQAGQALMTRKRILPGDLGHRTGACVQTGSVAKES